jgi:hypothetical protein
MVRIVAVPLSKIEAHIVVLKEQRFVHLLVLDRPIAELVVQVAGRSPQGISEAASPPFSESSTGRRGLREYP